jgi:hypothetical protein
MVPASQVGPDSSIDRRRWAVLAWDPSVRAPGPPRPARGPNGVFGNPTAGGSTAIVRHGTGRSSRQSAGRSNRSRRPAAERYAPRPMRDDYHRQLDGLAGPHVRRGGGCRAEGHPRAARLRSPGLSAAGEERHEVGGVEDREPGWRVAPVPPGRRRVAGASRLVPAGVPAAPPPSRGVDPTGPLSHRRSTWRPY